MNMVCLPCGLPIVVRLLVWPPPGRAFHWNSVRRGLNQSVNSNWRGSSGHFFVFCSFLSLNGILCENKLIGS